jgi:hypothetical protein
MDKVMLDLCCGRGGWTKGFLPHGFKCYGYDIDPKFRSLYPGSFIEGDVRKIPLAELRNQNVRVVCASSPCEEFSRFTMPWTRAKNPPEPILGIELARACFTIAEALGVPLIFENVRLAQRWLGRAVMHCGPFYLWGDGVPCLLPRDVQRRVKESYGSKERDKRAEIPFELADWIARLYA